MPEKPWDDSDAERALADRVFGAFPEMETPRFHLRALSVSDARDVLAVRGDELVTREFVTQPLSSEEGARAFIEMERARFLARQGIRWAIAKHEDERVVGTLTLGPWNRKAETVILGYEIARAEWRKGIASEAAAAACAFAFGKMNAHRVEAHTLVRNVASARLLMKLGFVEEGTLRERWHALGSWHDLKLFGLLEKDFTWPKNSA